MNSIYEYNIPVHCGYINEINIVLKQNGLKYFLEMVLIKNNKTIN